MNAKRFPAYFIVLTIFLLLAPLMVVAEDENAKCTDEGNPPYDFSCPVGQKSNKPGKVCGVGITASYSKGSCTCVASDKCKATTAAGADGKGMSVGDLSKLFDGISKLMQAFGGGAGAAPPSPPGGQGANGGTGCAQYYQVSTPSTDPCAYYVPQTSNSINTDRGSGSIEGTNGNPSGATSDLIKSITGQDTGNSSNANTDAGDVTSGTSTSKNARGSSTITFIKQERNATSSLSGDIRVSSSGATVIVENPDSQRNSVIAGFLGTNSDGHDTQPQGIVQGWCKNRPWASNFLSFIIPASFFDGLCTLRGYSIGQPSIGGISSTATTSRPAISLTQTSVTRRPVIRPATTTPPRVAASSTPVYTLPAPQADIWAVPAAVPLGTRTTVYWNSKNVVSCLVSSPDGSFSHTSLSGGGATVPLSGATTFTISCDSADGQHATDFVTVRLSL